MSSDQSPDHLASRREVDAVINMLAALEKRVDEDRHDLPIILRNAVKAGIHDALCDTEMVEAFWRAGYKSLSMHASEGASKWAGKRLITVAVTFIFTASLIWLVKAGAFGALK